MGKIFCVSEIIFSINDPRQQIADELRHMKTRFYSAVTINTGEWFFLAKNS